MRYAHFCDFVEPIRIGPVIISAIIFSKLISPQYFQFSNRSGNIHKPGIEGMDITIRRAFLCGDDNYSIGAAGAIDGRSRAVFQYIDGLDIVFIHIVKTSTGDTVDDNQWA